MKITYQSLLFLLISSLFISCNDLKKHKESEHNHKEVIQQSKEHEEEESHNEFTLTNKQFKALQMELGETQDKNMGAYVQVNGQLKVPPQNEASITSFIGASITSIKVIEGEKVRRGQTLAYLSHPEIIKMQTNFLTAKNSLELLKKKYNRQKKLYEAGVASGSSFQNIESEYKQSQTSLNGMSYQLQLLNINTTALLKGKISKQIAVKSSINGYVQKVSIKTGQFVNPQTELFEVVNVDQVHADLMVYEKDIPKVKKGQTLRFSLQTRPDEYLFAKIFSVGKVFEDNPKAVHIHADILDKKGALIPGMYIQGKIEVNTELVKALPEEAISKEGDKFFVFGIEEEQDFWHFHKIEVIKGKTDAKWTEVRFLHEIDKNTQFAYNNAYYLIAELNKGALEHEH
jgi:cobalt-zinc-cadmium efflux system membrane fusion protein